MSEYGIVKEGAFISIYPGVMFRFLEGNLNVDINAAYTTQKMYYINFIDGTIELFRLPLVLDASATYGFLNQRLFLGLKGIADIYYKDRGGHALRIIPMLEVWPARFFSVRGGYEYSHLNQADTFTISHGAVAGLTFKVWRFDINANLTFRQKPARILPGTNIANMKLLIGLEFTPNLITRQ